MFRLVHTGRRVTYSIVCLFICALTVFCSLARCSTLAASTFIWERKEVETGGVGVGRDWELMWILSHPWGVIQCTTPINQPVPLSPCGLEHTLPVSPQFFSDTMTKFLYEMCQQAIMVVIFIKANIQSSSPKMMNTATSVACISVVMSHRGNGSLTHVPIIIKGIFSIVTVDAGWTDRYFLWPNMAALTFFLSPSTQSCWWLHITTMKMLLMNLMVLHSYGTWNIRKNLQNTYSTVR